MAASVTSGFERWFAAYAASSDFEQAPAPAHFNDEEDELSRRSLTLPYEPFAKQQEFHLCPAKYRLFGGAAGPGKSKALLMDAIVQANEVPRANTLLLRKTFPELEGSLLLYFRRDVPRELYRSFNEAKRTVTWLNGSTTRFGYSQSENDIYQYQSGEYLFIGIDELTHFNLRQWQFLTSRNRCPVPGSFPNMAGATNPGNIGHAWVKALFIDKQPAAGMDAREYDPADYAFISARVWDNPIYADDPSYLKTLQQLPDFFRRAFLDGDWSVFAGQYFTNFDPSRSVIRAETIAAEAWWPRWISIDWGFEHPAAVYWHTTAPSMRASVATERPAVCRGGFTPPDSAVQSCADAGGMNPPLQKPVPPNPPAHFVSVGVGYDRPAAASAADISSVGSGFSPDLRDTNTTEFVGADCGRPAARSAGSTPAGAGPARQQPGPTSIEGFRPGQSGTGFQPVVFDTTHFAEGRRHRLEDSHTHAHGCDLPAKNVEAHRAGVAAPSTINEGGPSAPTLSDGVGDPESEGRPYKITDAKSSSVGSGLETRPGEANASPLQEPVLPNPSPHFVSVGAGYGRPTAHGAGMSPAGARAARQQSGPTSIEDSGPARGPRATTITYREFVEQHLAPRTLAAEIIERSRTRDGGIEKIDAIYLSPDAFARRTDESSIAEQMGDVLAAAGLPRPVPADNDRIGGWMLMYQMLDANEWQIADSCPELIRTLPELVRDAVNIEDIAKRDGDDAADAARYGLKTRASARVPKPPREQELQERVTSNDPTIRAIQARKAELDLRDKGKPVFSHWPMRWRRR